MDGSDGYQSALSSKKMPWVRREGTLAVFGVLQIVFFKPNLLEIQEGRTTGLPRYRPYHEIGDWAP